MAKTKANITGGKIKSSTKKSSEVKSGKIKRITARALGSKAVKGKDRSIRMKRSYLDDCSGTACNQLRIIHVSRGYRQELIINIGCANSDGVFITKQPMQKRKKGAESGQA